MKRLIALVLVGSIGLQASGCTTTFPAQPILAAGTAIPPARPIEAAPRSSIYRVDEAPKQIAPPDVPTSEFLGGPAAGMLLGVVLLGGMALAIALAGKGSSGSSSNGLPN